MKKYLFVLSIFYCLVSSAQQINNAGLENWLSSGPYQVPDSFTTFDDAVFIGTPTSMPTTDAHSGNFAALMTSQQGPGTFEASGSITYGYSQSSVSVSTTIGWPFTGRPVSMKFWYKYLPSGNDSAIAGILLT